MDVSTVDPFDNWSIFTIYSHVCLYPVCLCLSGLPIASGKTEDEDYMTWAEVKLKRGWGGGHEVAAWRKKEVRRRGKSGEWVENKKKNGWGGTKAFTMDGMYMGRETGESNENM